MHWRIPLLLAVLALLGCGSKSTQRPAIDPAKVIDLSHPFGPDTIYWPTAQPFELRRVAYGRTPQGYFYAANNISMAEHGGTHMDAPIHFAEGKRTSDQVPLSNCIGPAAVIDVSAKCADNPDYELTTGDVQNWESRHGKIPRGAIVVMHTGYSHRWPDKKSYLGTDEPLDVANLRFPGFSKSAVEFLVNQRDIAAVAIDTASIDPGRSKDFVAHQVLNAADKPAFENLAHTADLPPTGATIIALPLNIRDGTGGPARVIAVLP
jgi:kynurenine formamidase